MINQTSSLTTGLSTIRAVPASPKSRIAHYCACCGERFYPSDDRAVYCSKTCQTTISNYHKRVAYAFRDYAKIGFTLTWDDPKLFFIKLPESEEYPVPDGFALTSHYGLPENRVDKWNALIIIHNTLFGLKNDVTHALELAVNHALNAEDFWTWFYFFWGVTPMRECPDCHEYFGLCDLWWAKAYARDVYLCCDCSYKDANANHPF